MVAKRAFITGITGQDGYYLSELLLQKGYIVNGLVQPHAHDDTHNLQNLISQYGDSRLCLHTGDLLDGGSLARLIAEIRPDEIYNLGAQSHVAKGFDAPEYTVNANALGTLRLLESIRALGMQKHVKFYQASTSEMFGNAPSPQNEDTRFSPESPYAASKLLAHNLVKNYRDAYGFFAVSGILFNHESPLRGHDFVTQKIASAVCAIECGKQDYIELGNLNAVRDWGHAKDYVKGMWAMLQQTSPEDFVLATGEAHTVRELCEYAFSLINVQLNWSGEGVNEIGKDKKTAQIKVRVNPRYFRPLEVNSLTGDASKARQILGWKPEIGFEKMIKEMVESARRKDTAPYDYIFEKNG